jgi:hypothetical protein
MFNLTAHVLGMLARYRFDSSTNVGEQAPGVANSTMVQLSVPFLNASSGQILFVPTGFTYFLSSRSTSVLFDSSPLVRVTRFSVDEVFSQYFSGVRSNPFPLKLALSLLRALSAMNIE